jgi:hypothetical protein
MRKRRLRKQNHPGQNLDSFLDILTNTVGVLMFVGLFVSLVAVESGSIIRTPLRKETQKKGQFFEVRNNQIFYINNSQVDNKLTEFINNLPSCIPPDIPDNVVDSRYDYYMDKIAQYQQCLDQRDKKLENFTTKTDYYAVIFLGGDTLKYEPIKEVKGETKEDLQKDNSNFTKILNNISPNNYYLGFLVRPDSFAMFRQAREKAWSQGFDVGWEPLSSNTPLIFGSGGRSIGVQ